MDPLTQQLVQRQMGQPGMATPPQMPQPPMPGAPGQFPQLPQVPPNPLASMPDSAGGPLPATPPNPHQHVPPEAQRFQNAQQIQDAYRGGWNTNPVLLQASLSK